MDSKALTARQVRAYELGRGYRGLSLTAAWTKAIYSDLDVNPDAPVESACFEAGVLGHELPRWVTGWRYGRLPLSGCSRNHRDDHAEAGVSIMQIDGAAIVETSGTHLFQAFNAEGRDRVRVGGWLIQRRGSDGEPLLVAAVEL